MSPLWGHLVGVITTVLMLTFIGIWIWAWRRSHRETFDRLARLPMEDEDLPLAYGDEQ
ncbi:MAG TPA: cbb3-type cytochrome c oxidase subunit 3 [Rhodanobacteraceae bacterium]|nr:cbb3-type cytochrome c oxidase subunit 3 [Rhodanobacteraceae bacterium]